MPSRNDALVTADTRAFCSPQRRQAVAADSLKNASLRLEATPGIEPGYTVLQTVA
jgi:hypothetical protein